MLSCPWAEVEPTVVWDLESLERVKLKELCEKQARFRKSVVALQPNSRLKLDPLLAADLKEKLELRTSLEEELLRHKQAHGSGHELLSLWPVPPEG
ncbi:hypothetical protein Pcinc_012962 [Petrolisthes cinctipes]|uniref:Uncharacterized protein n=1 Tax=Petrolisthes cinctipes TaxID=88211 RepID=A0AAE1FZU8_PETCI|nr:hypothetical protein Pcinc_012962 [Petrolisthes cinctipes]